MTPEELDQWRGQEARRLRHEYPEEATEVIAARLAREGRMPPEPVVDPDLLAFREFAVRTGLGHLPSSAMAGKLDNGREARAFLAGARMAREQERERSKGLVEFVGNRRLCGCQPQAQALLAKYQGEA